MGYEIIDIIKGKIITLEKTRLCVEGQPDSTSKASRLLKINLKILLWTIAKEILIDILRISKKIRSMKK